jgi:DNA-binding transcriptional regulator GbsR (MarR family)
MDPSRLIDDAQRQFVEDMALLMEALSQTPRNAGRIYGYLVMTGGEHDQAELAEALDMSQASVSTMTRRLIDTDVVERVGVPGSRRDRYRLRQESWAAMAKRFTLVLDRFIEQAERGLALVPDADHAGHRHLRAMRTSYQRLRDFLESEAVTTRPGQDG